MLARWRSWASVPPAPTPLGRTLDTLIKAADELSNISSSIPPVQRPDASNRRGTSAAPSSKIMRARESGPAAAVALMLVASLVGCGGGHAAGTPAQQTGSPTTSKTATSDGVTRRGTETYDPARMSLREAIGQHMVFAYSGTTPPRALTRRIARGEAAGVILSARNVRSLASLRRQMA